MHGDQMVDETIHSVEAFIGNAAFAESDRACKAPCVVTVFGCHMTLEIFLAGERLPTCGDRAYVTRAILIERMIDMFVERRGKGGTVSSL